MAYHKKPMLVITPAIGNLLAKGQFLGLSGSVGDSQDSWTGGAWCDFSGSDGSLAVDIVPTDMFCYISVISGEEETRPVTG